MNDKKTDKTSKRPKKRVSSSVVAEVVGCAPSTVRTVNTNKERNKDTVQAQKIELAQELLEDGFEKLLTEVKRIVKI